MTAPISDTRFVELRALSAEPRRLAELLHGLLDVAVSEHERERSAALRQKHQQERDLGLAKAEFAACMARQFKFWGTHFESMARDLEEP